MSNFNLNTVSTNKNEQMDADALDHQERKGG